MGNRTVISLTCTNGPLSFTINSVRSVPHLHCFNNREHKWALLLRLYDAVQLSKITFILLLFTTPHRRRPIRSAEVILHFFLSTVCTTTAPVSHSLQQCGQVPYLWDAARGGQVTGAAALQQQLSKQQKSWQPN